MDYKKFFYEDFELPEVLTKQETNKLLEEFHHGSKEAKDKLLIHNIRFILHEIRTKFINVDYDKNDLLSIGYFGLEKAIDTYDFQKGYEFSTYASKCIDNEILMFLRKLKKHQRVDSMDRILNLKKDETDKLKLEDTVSDKIDLEEETINNELKKIVRKFVEQLPDREKEIIKMHFGFYDNHIYSQREIADILKLSPSYVSRLVSASEKKIREQFIDIDVIESEEKKDSKKGDVKKMKRIKTIYEMLKEFSREEINKVLMALDEKEKALLKLRYGDDLDNPINSKLTKEETKIFYGILIPKIKRLLHNPLIEHKKKTPKKKVPLEDEEMLYEKVEQEAVKSIEVVKSQVTEEKVEKEKTNMTKSDCLTILELLRTPTFTQMMNVLTPKESIIISLRLGYIDGKYFSSEAIAQFLGIEKLEVIETTKKVLILYKESINKFIDSAIEIVADTKEEEKLLSLNSNNQ